MNRTKRILSAALAACLLLTLAACGGKKGVTADDAKTYIQGDLDAYYRGIYNKDYIDLVEGMTEADAKEMHQENLELEADYLLAYLEVEYPDDAVTAKAQELVEKIYAQAKYTVGQSSKLDSGDFAVEVTISPIEVVSLIPDELYSDVYFSVLEQNGVDSQELLDALSDEEYAAIDAQYGMAMLAELEALLPELTYGKEQSVMFQLKLDDEGYYTLTGTAYQTLDDMMIDYTGYYMQ